MGFLKQERSSIFSGDSTRILAQRVSLNNEILIGVSAIANIVSFTPILSVSEVKDAS